MTLVNKTNLMTTLIAIGVASMTHARTVDATALTSAVPSLGCGTNASPASADNAAALQCALNALQNENGGTLYIPTGSFKVGTLLMVGPNVQIRGDGESSILVQLPSAGPTGLLRMQRSSQL